MERVSDDFSKSNCPIYRYILNRKYEKLLKLKKPLKNQRFEWWSVGGSNRDAQPASLEKRGGCTPSFFHLIKHLIIL